MYKDNIDERQDYIVRKILLTPNIANDSQRNELFYTYCIINKNSFNLIINSARCENINGKHIVDKMKLLLKPYPEPYKIGWTKSIREIRVYQRYKISFFIGNYMDEMCSDVVDMNAYNLIFNRPM